MAELLSDVQDLFREVIGDRELVLEREATAEDVEGWDSITHVNLLFALEQAFDVIFTTAEMARLTQEGQTVGDLVDLVGSKVEGRGRNPA